MNLEDLEDLEGARVLGCKGARVRGSKAARDSKLRAFPKKPWGGIDDHVDKLPV